MPCSFQIVSLSVLLTICASLESIAHDIPNARIDRSTQVILAPGVFRVRYEINLAELTLAQDLRQLDGEAFQGTRAELFERYARVVGPLNARGLLLTVNDLEVELLLNHFTVAVEDHLYITFDFSAAIPAAGRIQYRDTNYAGAEGSTRLGLEVTPGLQVDGKLPPVEVASIPWQSVIQMSDEAERLTKTFDLLYRSEWRSTTQKTELTPKKSIEQPAGDARFRLTRLLDSPAGVGPAGWLVIAYLLGAFHAIQPGHGKTLVAAATIAGPNAISRGMILGILTAIAHLSSVAAIAGMLWWFQPNQASTIHSIIARTSGLLIAVIGVYRVGRHLAGYEPMHGHADLAGSRKVPDLWTLGLASGAVPCWDAVALVVLANSMGQLRWGLTLLVAFSMGLATVLVSIGWLAGRLRHGFVSATAQHWLGFASGIILTVIGLNLLGT